MGHHHSEAAEEDVETGRGHAGNFLSGVLLGTLVGMGAGLLLAPASGQSTLQRLRDGVTAARDQAKQAAEDTRTKAEELQRTGREMLVDNKRRLVRTAEAVKESAQAAWAEPGDHDESIASGSAHSLNEPVSPVQAHAGAPHNG